MSKLGLIIEERSRDIGDFIVGRVLPFRKKRMVGPFIFIDHMTHFELGPEKYMDVDQHPHIGLATLTYLLEGAVMHKDSIGSEQIITPGSVNIMAAGKGVTHTERTPDHLRKGKLSMQGYQIWIALPKHLEEMEPEFHHLASTEVPTWKEHGATFKLIAGSGFGITSKLPSYSPMFMVEIKSTNAFELNLDGQLKGEIGILVSSGNVSACDEVVGENNMLVSKTEDICKLQIHKNSRIFLLGGEPFNEKRFMDWNFVASDKARLAKARQDWIEKRFPKVPNDETYIPYPNRS